MKIRIKFSKHGSMKFIGHLDIMRYFQKAMRRADIDIRYSEGFSPHQIMSFAAPLGVGIESNAEYFDIEVNSTQDSAAMLERLNACMVEGIRLLSWRLLPDDSKPAMSIVTAADYILRFREGYEPEDTEAFFAELDSFYRQEKIPVTKPTKKGSRELDLKALVYDLHRVGEKGIFLSVSTGSTDNLKPELVLQTCYEQSGRAYSPFTFQIEREEVYGLTADGKQLALEAFGKDLV